MEFGWHVVTLVPVGLPLSEDWESWLEMEVDILVFSSSMGSTDVADVIIVVKATNILWQKSAHGVDGILTMVWIDVWHVVNS